MYHNISNIRCPKSQNLNVSCLVLQLSLPNPLKQGVKSRMMYLGQRWQAMLQLHLSDQQVYCLISCDLHRDLSVIEKNLHDDDGDDDNDIDEFGL